MSDESTVRPLVKCPVCDGVGFHVEAQCCGRSGEECCGSPEPVQVWCANCGGYGEFPETVTP